MKAIRQSIFGLVVQLRRGAVCYIGGSDLLPPPLSREEELALTNISYIIVGAEADLSEALGLILSDHEMSPSATVWLTQDAGVLLDACEDPAARLAVLEEQGVEAPTVVMVLAALKTDGQVELPVLSLADGRLEPAGQAVWEEKV